MTDIAPDSKDWTWVLDRRCDECGFDPAAVTRQTLAARIGGTAGAWQARLSRPDARRRPVPSTWSPTEYGAHVRDMAGVMAGRLELILKQASPEFADWDQDAAAVEGDYASAEPDEVGRQVTSAVEQLADAYAAVTEDQWDRPGLRSNGASFTAYTLGVYALHDLVHHAHDAGV